MNDMVEEVIGLLDKKISSDIDTVYCDIQEQIDALRKAGLRPPQPMVLALRSVGLATRNLQRALDELMEIAMREPEED